MPADLGLAIFPWGDSIMIPRIPKRTAQEKKHQTSSARSETTVRIQPALLLVGIAGWFAALPATSLADDTSSRRSANFLNLEAIERVRNEKEKVANAAWWGFDEKDATAAIQGAINSGAKTVIVPYVGHDWIVRPIKLASNQEIILEPGVVIMASAGAFKKKLDCLFEGIEVENVTIRGYGAILRMRKKDYAGWDYDKSEFRHTLSLKGVKNVTVLGLRLESSGGDGIYIGPTWDDRRIPCRHVVIRDCTCDNHYRQGISVVSAEHLRIENCTISNTRGTSPQAAVDLEPSNFRDRLVDVEVRNCIAKSNEGTGFSVHLGRLTAQSPDVSVRIVNCLVRSSRHPSLRAMLNLKSAPRGIVEFKNCVSEDIINSGVWGQWNTAAPIKLRFADCKWQRVGRKLVAVPVSFELTGRGKINKTGGIEFVNCYVYDDKNRPALAIKDIEKGDGKYQVTGKIRVINPYGDMDDGTPKGCTGLDVTYRRRQE